MNTKIADDKPCPKCGRWKNRATTVDGIVIVDDQVLLVKRKNNPHGGLWALPGGYIDFDETAKEAVIREVLEETSLKANQPKFVGVQSDPNRDPYQNITLVFVITDFSGKPIAGDDASDTKWARLEELPEQMAFDHKEIITKYASELLSS